MRLWHPFRRITRCRAGNRSLFLPHRFSNPEPDLNQQRPLRRIAMRKARHASPFPPLRNPSLRPKPWPNLKLIIPLRLRDQQGRMPVNNLENRERPPSRRTKKRSNRLKNSRPQVTTTERIRWTKNAETIPTNSCKGIGHRLLAASAQEAGSIRLAFRARPQ